MDCCRPFWFNALTPTDMLRSILACAFLVVSFVLQAPLSAEEIQVSEGASQVVYIAVGKAEVRSGPDEDYYPTTVLPRGESLEAFHRTEEGWLGVRPPEGSFSWVPASDAYLLPGGKVIEITNDKSVSWIGTELGSAKQYRWQVQLRVGEQLAVIGESIRKLANGSEVLWYRVSPPAGEFRWIHEAAVSSTPISVEQLAQTRTPQPTPTPTPPNDSAGGAQPTSATPEMSTVEAAQDQRALAESRANANRETAGAESQVVPAQFEGDVFSDSVTMEGVPAGESILVDEYAPMAEIPVDARPINQAVTGWDAFDGWHAFSLTDHGFRATWLDRWSGNAGQPPLVDPLEHDPYSLAMPNQHSSAPQRTLPPDYYTSRRSAWPPGRRSRPWRDPRTLGSPGLGFGSPAGTPAYQPDYEPEAYVGPRERQEPEFTQPGENLLSNLADRLGGGVSAEARRRGWMRNAREAGRDRSTGYDAGFEEEFDSGMDGALDVEDGFELGSLQEDGFDNSAARRPQPVRSAADETVNWYGIGDRGSGSGTLAREVSAQTAASPINASVELEQLNLQLSEMVAQSPNLWNLDPLLARAKTLIEHGANPVERGQARLLHDRILEFQQHSRRSALVPGTSFQAGVASGSQAPVMTASFGRAVSGDSNSMSSAEMAGRQPFDATGWLVPVHATTPGQPTHALTDASGAIVTYVTALPGMNLGTYLNQAVGIVGLRGYLPRLQAGHIQAERITRLR